MSKPEIDWGDEAPKRSWESDEARRLRQTKRARDMEWEATLRRRKRLRLVVGLPLTLAVFAGAALLGLDYAGVLPLGIPPHDVPAPPTVVMRVAAPVPTTSAPAASVFEEPPDPPPAAPVAVVPVVAVMAADPATVAKLRDRMAHADNGVAVIERERQEKLAALRLEDRLLRGTPVPTPSNPTARLQDSLYDMNRANALRAIELQGLVRSRQPGAELAYSNQIVLIQNVQAQIANTITNENHDAEVLRSLNARLLKAAAERDRLAADLRAAGIP